MKLFLKEMIWLDEKLRELINKENEANNRLDYADDDYSIDININVLNTASNVTVSYIEYKRAEQEYLRAVKERDLYCQLLKSVEINKNIN